MFPHIVERLPGVLQVGREVETLLTEPRVVVADVVLGLGFEHGFGDIRLHQFDQLVAQRPFKGGVGGLLFSLLDICPNVGFVFIQRIEFRNVLRELVVQGGELDRLDAVQLAGEDRVFTGKFLRVVLGGEGDLHVERVADRVTDDLIFEAGDEAAAPELEVVLLGGAAVERDPVDRAFIVDVDRIVVLRGTVGDVNGAAVPFLHALDFGVDFLVRDRDFLFLGFESDIALDLDLGLHVDGRLEQNAVLVDGLDIDLGAADHVEFRFLDRRFVCVGHHLIDGVLVEHALAVHLFDDMTGRLSAAETGNGDGSFLLIENVRDRLFKGLLVDREADLKLVVSRSFLFRQSHWFFLQKKTLFLITVLFYNERPVLSSNLP